MVDFFKESDRKSIVAVWQRAFGDNENYVNHFIDASCADILVYRVDNVVVGMVSLLDIYVNGQKGGYIYALAVDKEYRNQGIATRLLSFAQEVMLKKQYSFSVVVPEPYCSLEAFYKKLGFDCELPLYKSAIQCNRVAGKATVVSVDKDEYYRVRTSQANTVIHSKKFFDYVYDDLISDGYQFLKIQNDCCEGYCVCVIRNDCAIIKEMLSMRYKDDFVGCICNFLNAEKATVISNEGKNKHPFALLKNFERKNDTDLYANLLLDSFGG